MKFIDPGFKGNNPGHYSTAVVSNGMLYVSGLLSMDPDTREVCTGNIEAHAAQALQNLDRVLKAAGVERSQVVFCRVYTPSNEYWGPINALYAQFFGEHKPGRLSFRLLRFTSAASLKSNALPNSKRMTDSN